MKWAGVMNWTGFMKRLSIAGAALALICLATESLSAQPMAPRERVEALRAASAAVTEGRYAEAEPVLRRLAKEHGSARALLWLSKMEMGRGRPLEARRLLDRALEIAPHSEQLLRAYAQAALGSEAPVAAILVLEPLARMHPSDGDYAYWLGVARLQLGDLAAAAVALEEALPLQRRADKALLALGLAQNKLKRFAEARASLEESLSIEPGQVEAMAALSEALQGVGEKSDAERLARRVLELAPNHATPHLVLGLLRMDEGDYAAAAKSLEASIAADPEAPRPHYQLGLAYARLGEREKSKKQLELFRQARKALEIRVENVDRQTAPTQGTRQDGRSSEGNEE